MGFVMHLGCGGWIGPTWEHFLSQSWYLAYRIPSSEQPNRSGVAQPKQRSGSRVLYVGMMLWNEAGVIFSIQFNNNAVPCT